MRKLLTPFRVGLLVIGSGAILFGFLNFVKKGGMSEKESIRVYAYFRDASGLGKKSRVQIAGIPVGEVGEIELTGTRAKVWLRIRKDVGARQDAAITKRSESLVLSDYMIDLIPGSEDQPLLADGDQIKRVIDAQGMEQVFNTLSAITQDIQQVTIALRNVLGGDKGQGSIETIVANMVKLSESVEKTVRETAGRLDQILANVEAVSGDVRRLTAGEESTVRSIVHNIEGITTDTREVLATVKKVIGSNEGDLKESVASLKTTLERLDNSLKNVEEITGNVKDGKGALGALVADNRIGQKVSETVDDVADLASSITGLQAEVGIKSDYLVTQGQAKNVLGIRLIPKPDKYYLLEFVDDPRGAVETIFVQTNPPNAGSPTVQRQTVTKDAIKVSAQFAKRYSFLTLRFGIIESTGGLGLDLSFPLKFFYYSKWIEDALVLKVDAFNFSVESLEYPRLRATLRFTPFDHIYVNVGVDDVLNRPNRDALTNRLLSGRDLFFGAGIYFTDSDLKGLLTVTGVPKL
ncbi:MAG: MlaD family protein [Myxococcaceae bacterium]|nr:MlaD family protein [Myxococcaceae bacterium]